MSFVSAFKAIVVTTPTAIQILKVASISAPSLLLAVRVYTTSPVGDAGPNICAEVGVTNPEADLFFPIPFAVIKADAIRFASPNVVALSPDLGNNEGLMPNKPSWWAVRYRPTGYAGVIPWRAKIYFDMVK